MILRTALVLALVCASSFAGTLALVEDPSLVVLDPGACLASSYRPWLGDSFSLESDDRVSPQGDAASARFEESLIPAVRGPGVLTSPLIMLAPRREPDRLVLVPLPPAAEAGFFLLAGFAAVGLFRRIRGARKA